MLIGARLRQLRTEKGMSQGDIEAATGLLRCYTSRIENGHTIPSLETLERFAAALNVPIYKLFYMDESKPPAPPSGLRKTLEELAKRGGKAGTEAQFLLKLKRFTDNLKDRDLDVLLILARKLATR